MCNTGRGCKERKRLDLRKDRDVIERKTISRKDELMREGEGVS